MWLLSLILATPMMAESSLAQSSESRAKTMGRELDKGISKFPHGGKSPGNESSIHKKLDKGMTFNSRATHEI